MKVLQINSVCGYGSTGRITTDLYDVLVKEGHECCIAYGRGNAPKGYNTIKIGNKFDFYSHVLKTRLFDLHGFGSKRKTKKIIKQIREYKPDVIHLHNIHGYYLNIEILFEFLSTIETPIVWLLHDAWSISGHSAHFELDDQGNIPKVNLNKQQKHEYPKSFFFDNSKKNYQNKKRIFTQLEDMVIISPSLWLKQLLGKSFLSKYPIKVINNGIDLNKFKPTQISIRDKYDLSNKKVILGVSSVWTEKKGLYFFNKLAEELDDSFKVILVGVNKEDEKNISQKIIKIYRTESIEELAALYTMADVFVNPTLEDTFPTTNIESLACGTPVITFNTGGSPEPLNIETGIVIQKNNYEQLKNVLESLEYMQFDSRKCIAQAQKFNKEDVYKEYIELYKTISA